MYSIRHSPVGTRIAYLAVLCLIAIHLYRTPSYSMDLIGYMGNALLYRTQDVKELHRLVYREVRAWPNARVVMGETTSDDPTQDASRKARVQNAGYFAEFLPCFAIRPLYNDALYVLSPMGISRAALLISVLCYFFLGWLLYEWTGNALYSLAMMLTPPVIFIGRNTTSDAPAILCAFAALYLIFKAERLFPGLLLLLVSVFVRTDNVMLVAPVLAAMWWMKKLDFTKCLVLGGLAAASVLFINHFAGDYGIAMLYYRNFGGTPIAPGEVAFHLSLAQYLAGFRLGLSKALDGFLIPFLLLGLIGIRKSWLLFAMGVIYGILHFLALPNYEERWFVIAYLLFALSAVSAQEFGRMRRPVSNVFETQADVPATKAAA